VKHALMATSRAHRSRQWASVALIGMFLSTAGGTTALAQQVAPAAAPVVPDTNSSSVDLEKTGSGARRQQFEVGDKLRISFYEHLGSEDDRWANSNQPAKPDRSFYLHPEVSGDYTVQSDGTISFPIIGDFVITNRSSQQVNTDLAAAFGNAIGRRASVNAILIERSPVYIIGPVKQPGVYRFQNGMTAFHAVALAGGFERSDDEKWTILDALRESGNVTAVTSRLEHLLAQWAVIHSELGNTDVAVPDRLVDLAGSQKAASLIREEKALREEIIKARGQTAHALASAVEAAQSQLGIARDRLTPLQSTIQLQQDRYAGLQKLFSAGHVDKMFLIQAQSELAAAEDRQANARSDVEKATQQLVAAKIDNARFDTKTITDLNQEAADLEREIGQLAPTLSAGTGMLDVMRLSDSRRQHDDAPKFEIIRSTISGPETIMAEGTTLLHPGDLVRVERKPEFDSERQASTIRSPLPEAVR